MRCKANSATTGILRRVLLLCLLVAPAAASAQDSDPDAVALLLAAAEAAAARENYASAVHHYHQVLQLEPGHAAARLQLARVLSWSRNYAQAVQQYDTLLAQQPAHHQAGQEKARVLSWAREYDASIGEYARLLSALAAGEAPLPGAAVDERQVRLEQARVLGWAQRYEESLAALAVLLPAGREPRAGDREVLLQRARVLSWSQRYAEALAAYDAVLALAPADYDARLGKAQTLYWSGRLPQAASLLRPLRAQDPQRGDAGFTLAAVEHGLGYNARALSLLDHVSDVGEADELRRRIQRQLRPVARFRAGLVNAREASAADPALSVPARFSTTRTLRYEAAVEFSLHPDVRMEVTNTVAQNLTSDPALGRFGGRALSTETLGRVTLQAAPGLRLTAGAGGGSAGAGSDGAAEQPRSYHLLYEVRPVFTRGPWRLDFTGTRRLADYTPIAVHQSAVQRRESAAIGYAPQGLRLGAELWRARYSLHSRDATLASAPIFQAAAKGAGAHVTPVLYRDDRLILEAGARYDVFGFGKETGDVLRALGPPPLPPATEREPGTTGFFTPRLYHRVAATGRMAWQATPVLFFDVNGSYGPQRISYLPGISGPEPAFRRTATVGAGAVFTLGSFRPMIAWDYFSTDTAFGPGFSAAARGGSYRAHSVVWGLSRRF